MNNFYKPAFFILILLFSFNNFLYSANNNPRIFKIDSITKGIDLNEFWKYHPGDDTIWASLNYDDSDWETINVKGKGSMKMFFLDV